MGLSKNDLETFRRLQDDRMPTFLQRPTQQRRGKWIEVPGERHSELSTAVLGVIAFVFLVGCIAGYLAGLVRLVGPF